MTEQNRSTKSNKSLSGNDFAGAGIQFAAALVLFVFLGSWLDKRLGTSPLFVVLGVFVGGGGGFYSLYRKVVTAQKQDDELRRKKREEGV
jgi:ATP synthase protein I